VHVKAKRKLPDLAKLIEAESGDRAARPQTVAEMRGVLEILSEQTGIPLRKGDKRIGGTPPAKPPARRKKADGK